jgi:hypothetical protein
MDDHAHGSFPPEVVGVGVGVRTRSISPWRSNLVTGFPPIKMKLAAPEPDMTVRGVYLATEIRARLSAITAAERRKVLATADEATTSAVLSGPGFLSGLSSLEIEAVRMSWATKRYPNELKRLQYLESIGDHLQRAGSLLLGYQMKVADQCAGGTGAVEGCLGCDRGGDGMIPGLRRGIVIMCASGALIFGTDLDGGMNF